MALNKLTGRGGDTGVVATHDNDQEYYNKYYSKDNNIDTDIIGQVSLASSSILITETDDNDFNQGDISQCLNSTADLVEIDSGVIAGDATYCYFDTNTGVRFDDGQIACIQGCNNTKCRTTCINAGYDSGIFSHNTSCNTWWCHCDCGWRW